MTKQTQNLLSASIVFLALSAGLIAVTSRPRATVSEGERTDHDENHTTSSSATAPCCPADGTTHDEDLAPAGHDHSSKETSDAVLCEDGCVHADEPQDPEAILSAFCEHDVRSIDCNECRYALGVARIDPNLERATRIFRRETAG